MEFGSLDTIVSCVSAGVGVTLLPKGMVVGAWFGECQKSLGLAKNILAAHGIMDMAPASDGNPYQDYVLTEKGRRSRPADCRADRGGRAPCSGYGKGWKAGGCSPAQLDGAGSPRCNCSTQGSESLSDAFTVAAWLSPG